MLKAKQLTAIRETFLEAAGHDLRLTDESLSAVIEKDVAKWDEMDGEDKIEFLTRCAEAMAGIAITDPGISAIVSRITADADFVKEIDICIEAAMKNKTTAVDIASHLKRVLPKQILASAPWPGSKAETGKRTVPGSNELADIVETTDQTGKAIRTVWHNDFVSTMPKGKEFETDIDDVKREQKAAGSVPRFKGKSISKRDLAAMLSTATAQRNAMRGMFKRAFALIKQLIEIEGMEHVTCDFIKGHDKARCAMWPKEYGKGKAEGILVTNAPKPLWMAPADNPGEGRDFSVTQVLAFDVAKALRMPNGGTMAELVSTAKTETATPEATAYTPEQLDDAVVTTWRNLSERDKMAALRTRLNSPDNEDTKEAYCALYLLLKPIYTANEKWYNERLNGPVEKTGT